MGNMENVIETKITRTELLDILIHEMSADLNAQQRTTEEAVRALQPFNYDEVAQAIESGRAPREVEVHRWGDGRVTVSVSVTMLKDEVIGASLRKHLEELMQAEADANDVNTQLRRIHGERGSLKVKLLRQMLSQTNEGRELITLMEEMKKGARKQLALKAKSEE